MKIKYILIVLVLFSLQGISQESILKNDSLKFVGGALGQNVFLIGDSVVNKNIFRDILSVNDEAYNYFRKGSRLNILSGTMGFLGGVAIGFTIANLIGPSENPYWAVGASGIALLIVNYPIKQSSRYNYRKSASIYNESLNDQTNLWNRSEINFRLSPSKFSLCFKF